jgi:hypothetical protein
MTAKSLYCGICHFSSGNFLRPYVRSTQNAEQVAAERRAAHVECKEEGWDEDLSASDTAKVYRITVFYDAVSSVGVT